ncbi:hypothetical protein [Clostridium estertheticum]|uniref:hypothetical protein n=1 Tax=Clostridium estertheticum TaxID=238834 RepID=UPI001C7CE23A|nr:hypothetical protein [Clostridium estertheticum]MBX4264483.1 hypothetical protein [Clostridium estertheticum]WLC89321.1 hypothetical protein KTC95_03600 [Clostridium estertheticum]
MINNTYVILMLGLIVVSGILSSFSDFKYGKIYNRQIIILFGFGIFFQLIWLILFDSHMLVVYLLNLIIGTFLGYFLYYYNIWAAGDAKLYSLFLTLVPVVIYPIKGLNIFPGFVILVVIFALGFLYIALETIYLFLQELFMGRLVDLRKPGFSAKALFEMLPFYLFAYIFAFIYNDLLLRYVADFYKSNIGTLKFLNFAIIFTLLSKNVSKKFFIISSMCGTIYLIIRFVFFSPGKKFVLNISVLAIVTVIILVRYLAGRYNYKRVGCMELKPGDVVSYGTVVSFLNSRVKGLPLFTTESPHSRISIEEVKSIIRWSKSKYGNDYVYIVRHIPFAPFITVGTFFYVIYKIIVL